ncbi:Short-chain dehydrogenase/reductase ATR7 [Fusarium oxysporum f. sp. albedinis]|nr:Short-chain dehydrogenase/reductase ATR7 [Fusarium oxysporum f. sp. albedinis]
MNRTRSDILHHISAIGNVDELHATTDTQHRQVPGNGSSQNCQLEFVGFGIDAIRVVSLGHLSVDRIRTALSTLKAYNDHETFDEC